MDPFEEMTHDDFTDALKPVNWQEAHIRLHTSALEAILQQERQILTLTFPDDESRRLQRSDIEALTRFLEQYANVQPLSKPDNDLFEGWSPTPVEN